MASRKSTNGHEDPNEIMVAWSSFSVMRPDARSDNDCITIMRGTRLRRDAEAVQLAPFYFLPDGTPANEIPSEQFHAANKIKPGEDEPRTKILTDLKDEDAMVATVSFIVHHGVAPDTAMTRVNAGDRVHKDNAFAKAYPDRFRPVIE